ncbi:MAG: hypothetical protein U0165_15710 [Polyangiaceae bacterium]
MHIEAHGEENHSLGRSSFARTLPRFLPRVAGFVSDGRRAGSLVASSVSSAVASFASSAVASTIGSAVASTGEGWGVAKANATCSSGALLRRRRLDEGAGVNTSGIDGVSVLWASVVEAAGALGVSSMLACPSACLFSTTRRNTRSARRRACHDACSVWIASSVLARPTRCERPLRVDNPPHETRLIHRTTHVDCHLWLTTFRCSAVRAAADVVV